MKEDWKFCLKKSVIAEPYWEKNKKILLCLKNRKFSFLYF